MIPCGAVITKLYVYYQSEGRISRIQPGVEDRSMCEDVLEMARAIRPYLPELVGQAADEVDRELAALLADVKAGAPPDSVAQQISTVLIRWPDAHNWAARVLQDPGHLPPELQALAHGRGYEALPGDGEPIPAQKYVCPDGDFVWYRATVGVSVPRCPTHDIEIVLE
jgi:hypothetical protein